MIQYLYRRVPDFKTLQAEVAAWDEQRDVVGCKIEPLQC